MKKFSSHTQKTTLLALSVALAMILSYVEMLLPSLSHIAPGIKMGLPNIIIITALYLLGAKESAIISFIRVFLTALLFTSALTGLYSLAGATLSLALMILLKRTQKFSMIFVSIIGAVSHNIGQISVFLLITQTPEILSYLPFLIIGGVLSGLAIGIISYLFFNRLKKLYKL